MTFVYILLVLILLSVFYFIYLQKRHPSSQIDPKTIDTIVSLANDKLSSSQKIIQTDLAGKKDAIESLIKRLTADLDKNQKKLESAEAQRIGNFESLKESLESYKKVTIELSASTEGLKKVLSNNQLRGAFGEKVAEDLLKQSGFVIGTDYSKQESEGSSRPDFTLYLPDKTKVNIDSKFPYANIIKMSETTDSSQKTQYLKLFEQDIKKKIAEVSTRDYIDPESNTVDFVVVFIPNEMIFSFIYEKFPDILGGMVLITVGSILLLNSFDVIPWTIWSYIFFFWPVIFIFIGLDIISGNSLFYKTLTTLIGLGIIVFIILYLILTN